MQPTDFLTKVQKQFNGGMVTFSTKGARTIKISIKERKWTSSYVKVNSKKIIDLNEKCKTIKLLEDSKRKSLGHMAC